GNMPPARPRTRSGPRWAWPGGRSGSRRGWTDCSGWHRASVDSPAGSTGCPDSPAAGPGRGRCRDFRHSPSDAGGPRPRAMGTAPGATMDSRERILAAVRSATRDAIDPAPTRDYALELSDHELAGQDVVDLFVERVDDYRAEVHVIDRAE